jgi:hypothetical protein
MRCGTKPLAKALYCTAALRLHLLFAQRATLAKEPRNEIHQHAIALHL